MGGFVIWWAPLSVHSLDLMTCPVCTVWQDCQGEAPQHSPWHKPFDQRVGARQSTANSKTRKNLLCHCSLPPVEMHDTCAEHLLWKCFFGMSCKLRLMVYGPNSKVGIKGGLKSNKNFSVWVWSKNNTLMRPKKWLVNRVKEMKHFLTHIFFIRRATLFVFCLYLFIFFQTLTLKTIISLSGNEPH